MCVWRRRRGPPHLCIVGVVESAQVQTRDGLHTHLAEPLIGAGCSVCVCVCGGRAAANARLHLLTAECFIDWRTCSLSLRHAALSQRALRESGGFTAVPRFDM